jgi:hypothetical protein
MPRACQPLAPYACDGIGAWDWGGASPYALHASIDPVADPLPSWRSLKRQPPA